MFVDHVERPAAPAAAVRVGVPPLRDGRRSPSPTGRDWRAADLELRHRRAVVTRRGTLATFHERGYAPSELFFVIGADAFAEIATWHDYPRDPRRGALRRRVAARAFRSSELPQRLPRAASRMVATRRSIRCREIDPLIILIDAPTADVSSTAIRARRRRGRIDRRPRAARRPATH